MILPAGIVSTGWPAVRDKCREMGITHDEWQAGMGRAILAKRKSGLYAAGIGGVWISIARQVGKTFTIGSIIFALCILFPGLKVLWTAHRTRTSDETFKALQGFARRKLIAPHILAVRKANGQQEIEFKNGSRILFGARESGFGRGFDDVDIEVFDECQILTEKALDDMVPATNVSPNPLIIFIGTPPKPTDPSEVFTSRRREAMAAKAASPDADGVGDTLLIEISADADADPEDREQWAKGNPSYPHRTPEHAVLRMKKILGDESFRREGMGIWDADAAQGAFPPSKWSKAKVALKGKLRSPVVAVEFRLGLQQSISLGVVAETKVGLVCMVGRYEQGAGQQWSDDQIVSWVVNELEVRGVTRVAADNYGENGPLIVKLEDAGIEVDKLNLADMRNACMGLHGAVVNDQVHHLADEPLETAVKGARRRKSGAGWLWSRELSTTDVGPLMAVAAAWWVHTSNPSDYDLSESFH